MKFTAHNILLNDGEKTMGDRQTLMAESAMWTSIAQTLDFIFPKESTDRSQLRVVDLGCLEGGYSVEFARLGFDTLGIEARQENLDKCHFAQSKLNLPNLHFVKDDVRNMGQYGKFDIVLCYGLLYHLDAPIAFLREMSKDTQKLLLLNTHFAPEQDLRYRFPLINNYILGPLQKRFRFLQTRQNYRLSPLTTHEGYRGRWYKEWNRRTPKNKIEKMLWASYNNNRSFWVCKKDLTKALHDVGFKHVFEQFNYTGDIAPHHYTQFSSRTMFVGIK